MYFCVEVNFEMLKDFKFLKVVFWNDYLFEFLNFLLEKFSKCLGLDVKVM